MNNWNCQSSSDIMNGRNCDGGGNLILLSAWYLENIVIL